VLLVVRPGRSCIHDRGCAGRLGHRSRTRDDDRARLRTALHMLHAARWLPAAEQDSLGRAITALTPA
ncbi:hypothetical protein, partial [Saccharopolyspora kobensis]|uniref:hypothetical protein n=1 Tax=Saccharopolyspora kobensis TaxID=146035 RepID=UPI0033577C3F